MTKAQERQLSGFVFAAWILAHPASSIVSPEPTVNTLPLLFTGRVGSCVLFLHFTFAATSRLTGLRSNTLVANLRSSFPHLAVIREQLFGR